MTNWVDKSFHALVNSLTISCRRWDALPRFNALQAGTIVPRAELERFVARVPRSMMVVIDEAYHDFAEDPQYASSDALVASAPNVVVVRTFSKIYGLAGMRLGYSVSSPENAAALQRRRVPVNINAAVLDAGGDLDRSTDGCLAQVQTCIAG